MIVKSILAISRGQIEIGLITKVFAAGFFWYVVTKNVTFDASDLPKLRVSSRLTQSAAPSRPIESAGTI